MDSNVLMKVKNVSKIYQMGEVSVVAIKNIKLNIYKGQFISISIMIVLALTIYVSFSMVADNLNNTIFYLLSSFILSKN